MPGFIADIFVNQNDYSFFSILRKIENNCLYFCSLSYCPKSYFIKHLISFLHMEKLYEETGEL